MKKSLFQLIIITWCFQIANCQTDTINNFGKYKVSSRETYEEIVLKEDSTFSYFSKVPFRKINIDGKWDIFNDTLILNGNHADNSVKYTIVEKYNPKLPKKVKLFNVSYSNGNSVIFKVIIYEEKRKKKVVSDFIEDNYKIKVNNIKYFYIRSVYTTSIYEINDPKSNEFVVRFNPQRLFIEEKWIIEREGIRPRLENGDIANYVLSKREK